MQKKYFTFLSAFIPFLGLGANISESETQKIDAPSPFNAPNTIPSNRISSPWPNLEHDIGFSIQADFLYWQANQTGMAYGHIDNYTFSPTTLVGKYQNINFEFSPGVRVAFGIRPHYDFWQINLIWTHLNTKASGFTQVPMGQYTSVTPAWNVPVRGTNGTAAKATWWANYNTLDLDITRDITSSEFFDFKYHLGLRNLWLHETYYLLFLNNSGSFIGTSYDSDGMFLETIWGIGPILGLDSIYKLGYGLSLFGKATFSLLWSNVESKTRGTYLISPPLTGDNLSALFHTTLPEIGLVIGAAFDTNLSKDRYHMGVQLGWELHTLFDANFLRTDFESHGDFNLSGLTLSFDFDF